LGAMPMLNVGVLLAMLDEHVLLECEAPAIRSGATGLKIYGPMPFEIISVESQLARERLLRCQPRELVVGYVGEAMDM
jgi:hypothetical protein